MLKLTGVSYDKVMASPTLQEKVETAFCNAGMKSFPLAISCDAILSKGSIRGNITLTFPTVGQMPKGADANLALTASEGELLAQMQSLKSDLGDAVLGKIEVMRAKLTTSSGTLAVFVRGCEMKMLGVGHCHDAGSTLGPDVHTRQSRWQIGDEASGTLEAAKDACCESDYCSGFNWDREAGKYLLFDVVSADALEVDPPDGDRTQCWQKVAGTDFDEEPGAAFGRFPAPLAMFVAVLALGATPLLPA